MAIWPWPRERASCGAGPGAPPEADGEEAGPGAVGKVPAPGAAAPGADGTDVVPEPARSDARGNGAEEAEEEEEFTRTRVAAHRARHGHGIARSRARTVAGPHGHGPAVPRGPAARAPQTPRTDRIRRRTVRESSWKGLGATSMRNSARVSRIGPSMTPPALRCHRRPFHDAAGSRCHCRADPPTERHPRTAPAPRALASRPAQSTHHNTEAPRPREDRGRGASHAADQAATERITSRRPWRRRPGRPGWRRRPRADARSPCTRPAT